MQQEKVQVPIHEEEAAKIQTERVIEEPRTSELPKSEDRKEAKSEERV